MVVVWERWAADAAGVRARRLNQKKEKKKATEKNSESRALLYHIAWRSDARGKGNNLQMKKKFKWGSKKQCNDLSKLCNCMLRFSRFSVVTPVVGEVGWVQGRARSAVMRSRAKIADLHRIGCLDFWKKLPWTKERHPATFVRRPKTPLMTKGLDARWSVRWYPNQDAENSGTTQWTGQFHCQRFCLYQRTQPLTHHRTEKGQMNGNTNT